ncbi:uncharacterized protein [Rutidosis leptorrhynchoides]|uniref:uncharacterized protein n=1 Tax=Rutidosis leptorrhynchoides TaxID=125765 RepID=UPI003A9999D4
MSDDSSISSVGITKISKLEFNDTLYLHPNDTSGASLITQKLKGTENYNVWSCAMKLALHTKNKLGFIDGTCVRYEYEDDEVLLGQWDRCNYVILTCILMSLSEDIQSGQPLSDYYHKLNSMWRQFDDMIKIDDIVSTNKSFQEHNQFLKLVQFLMGCDGVYVPYRCQILTSDPVPSVKTAFSIISRDESHRLHTSSSSIINKTQSSAFNSKTANVVNSNNPTNNKKKYKNPPLKCTNCNMLGHTIERCFELIGYPPGYIKKPFNQGAPRFNSNNCVTDKHDSCGTNVQLTSDQIMKLLNLVNEKPVYK